MMPPTIQLPDGEVLSTVSGVLFLVCLPLIRLPGVPFFPGTNAHIIPCFPPPLGRLPSWLPEAHAQVLNRSTSPSPSTSTLPSWRLSWSRLPILLLLSASSTVVRVAGVVGRLVGIVIGSLASHFGFETPAYVLPEAS